VEQQNAENPHKLCKCRKCDALSAKKTEKMEKYLNLVEQQNRNCSFWKSNNEECTTDSCIEYKNEVIKAFRTSGSALEQAEVQNSIN